MPSRDSAPFLLLALATLALPAAAQNMLDGNTSEKGNCAQPVTIITDLCGGLVFAAHVDAAGSHDDWLFDLTSKRESQIGFQPGDVVGDSWRLDVDHFRGVQLPQDVTEMLITWPDGWLTLDSGPPVGPNSLGKVQRQKVGERSPLAPAGASPLPRTYGTTTGIELRFAPLIVVNDTDQGGCTVGGALADPSQRSPGEPGFVVGYNILRTPGSPSAPCRASQLQFLYFVDLRTLNLACGDTNPSGPDGLDSPCDLNPDGDLVGIQNPDGLADTGDEVIIFADKEYNPDGTPRRMGRAPVAGLGYWYGIQAVVAGSIDDWRNMTVGDGGAAPRDMRVDANLDGTFDSVDIDGGSLEFYSPQADYGYPGLGLTEYCGGEGSCNCNLIYGEFGGGGPLPALGALELTATPAGRDVRLRFATGIETADILGFTVFRVAGDSRVAVGEGVIAARGGEGNVYSLVDEGALRRRGIARDGLTWQVDVLHSDGTPTETFGPFTLESATLARRR